MMSSKTVKKTVTTKNGIKKFCFFLLAIILESVFFWGVFYTNLLNYISVLTIVNRAVALILVVLIYSQNKSPSIKMPWIMLMMAAPVVGIALYILIGMSGTTRKMRQRYERIDDKLFKYVHQDETVMECLQERDASCYGISNYIFRESRYPVYAGSGITYYEDAKKALEDQKKDILRAKHYVFLEYFLIDDKEVWQEIEDILAKKANEGVLVRVFYDDIGSVKYIGNSFVKKLEKRGIQCRVFNPMMPVFNAILNNRDHRKMTIIDGNIGYTGGYNIANEYFNVTSPCGFWKDTGVRVCGEAVRSMVITFLEMWNAVREDDKDDDGDLEKYLSKDDSGQGCNGYVQFYADNPIDDKPIGEDVYMCMADRATSYLYYITPYLIITDEMSRTLGLAAKRGVDVRIVTPGIPDKRIVYLLTRSYYNRLAKDGVRIFEYTPGFCHAKMSVSDDIVATCGTINLDYRSLYHHFEDGCLMIDNEAVLEIKKDFDSIFSVSTEVTEKYKEGRTTPLKIGQLVLRLVAPLI